MKRVDLIADKRDQAGKGPARSLRRSGRIPAVLYGGGKSSPLSLNAKDLEKILVSAAGGNVLITLKVEGQKSAEGKPVILRDYQEDPVSGEVLHADLFEIDMKKPLRLTVPIVMKGDVPLGVKEGGVLQHNLREVEIEALPAAVPDHIGMDASQLNIGESIHLSDLPIPEGVRFLAEKDLALVSISAPISEERLEEMLAGTPADEGKEPEVIGKKKEEGEAEGEGEGAAKPAGKEESKS
ncbi:MAG TPA: 50S ribosomal protein L25 [Nitrospiria bacterium]